MKKIDRLRYVSGERGAKQQFSVLDADGHALSRKERFLYGIVRHVPLLSVVTYAVSAFPLNGIFQPGGVVFVILFCALEFFWLYPVVFLTGDKTGLHDFIFNTHLVQAGEDKRWRLTKAVVVVSVYLRMILCFLAVCSLSLLFDQKLDPGIAGLYTRKPVDDRYNAAIAFAGLDAPEGQDMFVYGRNRINGRIADSIVILNDLNHLTFRGDGVSFHCWTGGPSPKDKETPCATADQIRTIVVSNALLLERYHQILDLGRYYEANIGEGGNGTLWLKLSDLELARLSLLAHEGKVDEAMDEWKKGFLFYKRAASDYHTLVTQAVIAIHQGKYLTILPHLIDTPELARRHGNGVHAVLSYEPFGPEGWNVRALSLAEMAMFDLEEKDETFKTLRGPFSHMVYKPNALRNDFYFFAKEMIEWTGQSGPAFFAEKSNIMSKYRVPASIWRTFYNPIGYLLLSGILQGHELYTNAHLQNAYRIMLTLYVDALAAEIKLEDMRSFINAAPKDRQNPLTEQPFLWDSEKQTIYFLHPETGERNKEITYNPHSD